VQNARQVEEYFKHGISNKTGRTNNFGRMSDKASQIFQMEFTQNDSNNLGESSVRINRLNVVSLAGCEILNEDPEAIRVK
jgi:hypothetical protein